MTYKNTILICLSSIIFNLALFFPDDLYFLVFIFLIPIFYVACKKYKFLSFKIGFLWGALFFCLHFLGFIFLFHKEANIQSSFRVFIPMLLALYCAIYSGLWFFLIRKTISIFGQKIYIIFMACTFWTYLYFNWIRYGALWIFGDFIGYPFSYPLLPLVNNVSMLYFFNTGFASKSLFLILIILFSLFAALFFLYFNKKYLVFAFICMAPFFLGNILQVSTGSNKIDNNKINNLVLANKIGYVSPISSLKLNHSLDAAQEVYYKMTNLLDRNPKVEIIFMPESSCKYCLNKNPYIIDLWYTNILGDTVDLFIGAPYKKGDKLYNALYWISKGKIKKVYKKTRLMAFAEYTPKFWEGSSYLKSLFLGNGPIFSHGKNKNQHLFFEYCFESCSDIRFKPLICSDLFMGRRKELQKIKSQNFVCAVVAVNDDIFPMKYLRRLMFLYAKLEAIAKKRDILYVGYYFASWISKNGSEAMLLC